MDVFTCSVCETRCKGNREHSFYQNITKEYINKQGNSPEPNEKKTKINTCVMCLGILQVQNWESILNKIKEEIEQQGYDSKTFACALSFPNSILMREKAIKIYLKELDTSWNSDDLVPLKEAWKWCFGPVMANHINKTLESGATCPFLINVHMGHENETEELNALKSMVPAVFIEREKCHRKFRGESFTKKSVEDILDSMDSKLFKSHYSCPPKEVALPCVCSNISLTHLSIYFAGRYIKNSRELCQTPWVLDGKKVMETSIQDIIFEPIVDLYKISPEHVKTRLKFMSAGREDVDVRFLGDGRPFAIEVVNPTITLFDEESLDKLQEKMSNKPDLITVRHLQITSREDLKILKEGEEHGSKVYVALCVKLKFKDEKIDLSQMTLNEIIHSDKLLPLDDFDVSILREVGEKRFFVDQITPLRVLHRRSRLNRQKEIIKIDLKLYENTPKLFELKICTEAGTYIKEFIHGDFRRTDPSISSILNCPVDILALDVAAITLDWPPKTATR